MYIDTKSSSFGLERQILYTVRLNDEWKFEYLIMSLQGIYEDNEAQLGSILV